MQKGNVYHFTRSEWNDSKERDRWMELCAIKKLPAVGFYIANKNAYVYYDTESFGYDLYDGLLLRNAEIVNSLAEGVRGIYSQFGVNCLFTESSLRQKTIVPVENAEVISNVIYNFLLSFRDATLMMK